MPDIDESNFIELLKLHNSWPESKGRRGELERRGHQKKIDILCSIIEHDWCMRHGLVKDKRSRYLGVEYLSNAINKDHAYKQVPYADIGFDHTTFYKKDGKRFCVVTQPYGFSYREALAAGQFAEKYNLEFSVCSSPAWHYPGSTLFIVWYQKGNILKF